MDFSEALATMKNGKKCRRDVWPPDMIVFVDGPTIAVRYGNNPEPGWAATSADQLAVDWEVV